MQLNWNSFLAKIYAIDLFLHSPSHPSPPKKNQCVQLLLFAFKIPLLPELLFKSLKNWKCFCLGSLKPKLKAMLLKEQCHEDFAVLWQFCAKIITLRL